MWPALLAVATSGEEWQTRGLSSAARTLQDRLLVAAVQIHTDEGKHAIVLQPWETAIRGVERIGIAEAKRQIEDATVTLGGDPRMLPWSVRSSPKTNSGG